MVLTKSVCWMKSKTADAFSRAMPPKSRRNSDRHQIAELVTSKSSLMLAYNSPLVSAKYRLESRPKKARFKYNEATCRLSLGLRRHVAPTRALGAASSFAAHRKHPV